jgi:FkbM family methyltransferase
MISSAVHVLRHKGPGGLLIAVFYLAKIHIWRKFLDQRLIKKRIHNYWMDLDIFDQGLSRTLLLFGRREEDHRIILEKVLRKGMTVLDIGANIGYYALMEHRLVGPSGRIIAVEPSAENTKLLEHNIALNECDNVKVFLGAVSDTNETRTFHLSNFSNLHTFHIDGIETDHLSGRTVEVQTRTVPEVMDGFGRPDLIRMDVEGHEVEVINGMLDAVENGEMSPMILFETHSTRYTPDHDIAEPLRRLLACGYHARYLASSSERGTKIIDALGYQGGSPVKTDFLTRVIYENIGGDDLIDLVCRSGGVRAILLAKAS